MIRVPIDLDDPDGALATAAFGAGALIRLERSTTEGGVYAEVTTKAIVAATYHYDIWDSGGSATSWYRWRISNSANTTQSGYSDTFQGVEITGDVEPDAYATLAELLTRVDQDITDTRLLSRYTSALLSATNEINEEIGYDFFRHPQSGTETRVFEGSGQGSMCLHGDIAGVISATLIEVAASHSETYESLEAEDWELEVRNPAGAAPYDHLSLTSLAGRSFWPRLVRITGAFGWSEIPAVAREACIARARQLVAADPTLPGGIAGPEEHGRPIGPNRMPDVTFRLIRREQQRHWCYV